MTRKNVAGLLLACVLSASPVFAAEDPNVRIEEMVSRLTTSLSADVIQGSETEVYIALGQDDGVTQGSLFEIIRPGAPLKSGETIIGYEETPVAKVEVSRVREKLSICSVLSATAVPQAGDRAYQLRTQVKRLMVGQFTYNQTFNGLTKSLQEKLTTAMIGKGIQVVERDQLERVLLEQKLGYSGLVNSETAKQVGELLGAEGILLGTVSDMGNDIAINGRLIDVETGNAISAAEVEIPKTPLIARLLETASEDVGIARGERKSAAAAKEESQQPTELSVQVFDGFEFTLQKCTRHGGAAACELMVANQKEDRILFIGNTYSRLIDQSGGMFGASELQFGNERERGSGGVYMRMITGVPVRMVITFDKLTEQTARAALVEVHAANGKRGTVQFRDVPLLP